MSLSSDRFRSGVAMNLVAGLLGGIWSTLLQLAAVPIYLYLLGAEAYGLIGFHLVLTAALKVLDLGLSATVNRELARATAPGRSTPADVHDLVRTLEAAYWAIGLALGLGLAVSARWVALHWIHADALPLPLVERSLVLMGALVAVQWPLTMYQGGLMGLQRHVALQILNVVAASVTVCGGVLVLLVLSPSVAALFTWQLAAGVLQVAASAALLWRSMPPRADGARASIRPRLVSRVGALAAGLTGITALGTLVGQADRIVLSRVLPLGTFGYYTLAATVAGGVSLGIAPVFNAIFPRLSALRAVHDDDALRGFYRRASQAMTVLLAPLAATLVVFAPEVLLLWTRDLAATTYAAPVVRLLVVGAALHGLVHLPYAAQLADGWTRLALLLNLLFALTLVPALLALAPRYGGIAAGWAWIVVNLVYLAVSVPLTHRRLLGGGALRWATRDVALPAAAALLVALAGRALTPSSASPLLPVGICVTGGAALLAAVAAASELRAAILAYAQGARRSRAAVA